RGEPKWDMKEWIVSENRAEALDLSRAAIREKRIVLPRRCPLVEEFAVHMANDAKRLEEDEETGEARYRYIRAGADHCSLAFTYDCLAALQDRRPMIIRPRWERLFHDPILDTKERQVVRQSG